jgi:hypothetical protein
MDPLPDGDATRDGGRAEGGRPEEDRTEEDRADDTTEPEDADHPLDAAPVGFDRWRRDSALGAVGTGVARGLQAVFAPPQNEPVIVAEAPGDPPGADGRLRVILDLDDPTKSIALIPGQPDVPAPD